MRCIQILIALFAFGSASAATITFEEFPVSFGYTNVESNGFTVAADGFFEINNVGSNILGMYATDLISVEATSGASFSIASLDVFQLAGKSVSLTGFYSGGGTIQTDFLAVASGSSTVTLDAAWSNLERFEVELTALSGQTGLDNIVVTAVPIPAAVWLFASALGAVGFARRPKGNAPHNQVK